jgi:hypothetical protein
MTNCVRLAAIFTALFVFISKIEAEPTQANSSVILNYYGSVNCVTSGPASAPSAFTTQVKSSNGVCNVVEGAGGNGGSWAVNCDSSSANGAIFFCSDSACKEGCQKQPFIDNVCVPILVQSAPNSAASFLGKCVNGSVVVTPGASAISGVDLITVSVGALSVIIVSSLAAM